MVLSVRKFIFCDKLKQKVEKIGGYQAKLRIFR